MLKISGSPFIFGSSKIGLDFLCNLELAMVMVMLITNVTESYNLNSL
jgi:hypothetical protein